MPQHMRMHMCGIAPLPPRRKAGKNSTQINALKTKEGEWEGAAANMVARDPSCSRFPDSAELCPDHLTRRMPGRMRGREAEATRPKGELQQMSAQLEKQALATRGRDSPTQTNKQDRRLCKLASARRLREGIHCDSS